MLPLATNKGNTLTDARKRKEKDCHPETEKRRQHAIYAMARRLAYFFALLVITTATTIATMARMRSIRKKQIHRFFLAARAETMALSAWPVLEHRS